MVTMGILHNMNRMFTIIISPSVQKKSGKPAVTAENVHKNPPDVKSDNIVCLTIAQKGMPIYSEFYNLPYVFYNLP